MRNVSNKSCRENQNTALSRKSFRLFDNVEKCGAREAAGKNMAARCLID
jgi:hypothetical protein